MPARRRSAGERSFWPGISSAIMLKFSVIVWSIWTVFTAGTAFIISASVLGKTHSIAKIVSTSYAVVWCLWRPGTQKPRRIYEIHRKINRIGNLIRLLDNTTLWGRPNLKNLRPPQTKNPELHDVLAIHRAVLVQPILFLHDQRTDLYWLADLQAEREGADEIE